MGYFLPLSMIFINLHFGSGAETGGDKVWSYLDYKNYGPSNWGKVNSQCDHNMQSPIQLDFYNSNHIKFPEFEFTDYDKSEIDYKIVNNGYSAKITLDKNHMHVKMPGIRGTFDLLQLHLHWGKCNEKGSEHYVENKQYAAEIHFVHQLDESAGGVLSDEFNGTLMVLGTFLEVGEEDNPDFEKYMDLMKKVKFLGEETSGKAEIDLRKLMSPNTKDFYHYHGSLTTPPCLEAVYWFVFHDPIKVSTHQLDDLRNVLNIDDETVSKEKWALGNHERVTDNHRPLQRQNGRIIKRSFHPNSSSSLNQSWSMKVAITVFASIMYFVKKN